MKLFTPMASIIPEGTCGQAQIKHFKIDAAAAAFTQMRAAATGGREEPIQEGAYCQLRVNNQLVMSDTDMEKNSNMRVVHQAKGHVLIAGLGIGLILLPILDNPEVLSVTVIEKSPDVVTLVEPHIRKASYQADKLKVVVADIFTWTPPKGQKWRTIYHDIWPDICTDNLSEMTQLHRKYARRKSGPDAYMDSWMRGRLMRLKGRSRF